MDFLMFFGCILLLFSYTNADVKYPSHWVEPTNVRTHGKNVDVNYCAPCADTQCSDNTQDCKYNENDVAQIFNFYKRLVSMLGNSINRNRGSSESAFELRVRAGVSEDQHEVLKKFGADAEFSGDSLREIDNIISDILYESKQNSNVFDAPLDWIFTIMSVLSSPNNILIIFGFFCMLLTYRLIYVQFSVLRALSLLFLSCTILGYVWTWYHLVEEAEIRLMADRMQYPIPPECNAMDSTWWQRWFSDPNVDCHKYVRAHTKKAALEITPQIVIAEMFGQSFSHIFNHFIDSITAFLSKLYMILPWPLNIFAFPFLLVFVMILILQWSALVSGVRLKLNLFHLISYEVGSRNETRRSENLRLTSTEGTRQHIEEVRPESIQEKFQENTTGSPTKELCKKCIEPKLVKRVSFAETSPKKLMESTEIKTEEAEDHIENVQKVEDHIENVKKSEDHIENVDEIEVDSPCGAISEKSCEFGKKPENGSGDSA